MSAAEQATIERQYREARRKVDAVTVDAARARYLETLAKAGGLVAKAKAEGVRPDRRPEAIRKNADVINRARLSAVEARRDAYRALGYTPIQAIELAMRPTVYQQADAEGKVWMHKDREHLGRWIEQRNRTLLRPRARSSAAY
jgi:hypothetical protein